MDRRHPTTTPASDVTPEARRAGLFKFEAAMMKATADGSLPAFDCPLNHVFADGLYVRQMYIPQGVALVGHIHREDCINMVIGKILVATEEGGKLIEGPITFPSAAGVKRAGYALENTLWTTIHPNPDNERDIARLEARLIVDVYDPITGAARPDLLEVTPCLSER